MSGKKFNNIIQGLIRKSLFTERQIEIMLNQQSMEPTKINISRGAYYRQVSQCKEKLKQYYYTAILLEGLELSFSDDFNITSQISQSISQIKDQDHVESEHELFTILDNAVNRLSTSETASPKHDGEIK